MAHSSINKRQATDALKSKHNQNKKSKLQNHTNKSAKKGGLFDDSDEEMDPNVMENIMQQLDADDDDKSASANDSDSDDMELNDNNSDDDNDSISASDIPEDPITDLLQDHDQDQSASEDEDDMAAETESQQSDQPPSATTATNTDLAGKFRDHYMGQMTLAFGSDLDTIRQEPGFTGARLNVLIDSLESGITIFSDLEKKIILANAKDS